MILERLGYSQIFYSKKQQISLYTLHSRGCQFYFFSWHIYTFWDKFYDKWERRGMKVSCFPLTLHEMESVVSLLGARNKDTKEKLI